MRSVLVILALACLAGGAWAQPGPPAQCSSPAAAIPDNTPGGVSDDLVISGSGLNVSDLEVYLNITHSWVGDLQVNLEHTDTATSELLVDRPGQPGVSTFGCNGNNMDLTLADGEALTIENDCSNVTANEAFIIGGRYQPGDPPANLLASWAGESFDGTWRLTVTDNAGGDTGTLNQWCLDPGAPVFIDLGITKSGVANPDSTIDYTITVTNNGPGDATGVTVTDPLPACTTYISDDCGGTNTPPWTWNIGALANGASAVCVVTVDGSACTGTVSNTASVTGDQSDTSAANDNSTSDVTLGSVLEIPTLDTVGLAVLLVLLAAAALLLIRRRQNA
jgi:uncharacterized repeat protein (TIGR01451 family)